MFISMIPGALDEQVSAVEEVIRKAGYEVHGISGTERKVVAAIGAGDTYKLLETIDQLNSMPGVDKAMRVSTPFRLVSSERHERARPVVVGIGDNKVIFGGDEFVTIAGPCSVETKRVIMATAKSVAKNGAMMIRGGAFKPRSTYTSFQGLGQKALEYLAEAREVTGLPFVTEVMDVRDVELVARYADMLQIGTKNMGNQNLLMEVGKSGLPILLKRGFAATCDDWFCAADYVASQGNENIVLCERGIRTFSSMGPNGVRFTLDIGAVPIAKAKTFLPVIVDPSHAAGKRSLVPAHVGAAIGAGADGMIIEVHNNPKAAKSDSAQQLYLDGFTRLMKGVPALVKASKALSI